MRKSFASLALCWSLAACGGDDEFIPPVIDAAVDAVPSIDAFDAQGSGPDAPPMPDAAEVDAVAIDAVVPIDAVPESDAP